MNQNNNNMNYIKVQSEEIIFCEEDDRHILIKKELDEIIGINYCQGDDLEYFVDNYMDIDHELTDFYNAVKYYLSGENELDRVNQAIWAHFDFKNRVYERDTNHLRTNGLNK